MSVNINGSDGVDSSGKLQSGGDPNDGTAVGAKMLQSGLVQAARASGSATSAVFMGFTEGTAAATSRINANGSASFGGVLTGQSVVESTRFGESVQLGGAADGALVVGGSGANNKVKIGYDGTALFKSGEATNVTAQSTDGNGGFLNFSGLDSSGNTTFSVNHNGTIFTSSGLNFGTATSPVISKTLSDYEEGTFVPKIEGSLAATGQSYTTGTRGNYVKVGKLVHASFYVELTSKGTLNGSQLMITGLPFPVQNETGSGAGACGFFNGLAINVGQIQFNARQSTSSCFINRSAAGGGTGMTNDQTIIGNSSRFDGTFTYITND